MELKLKHELGKELKARIGDNKIIVFVFRHEIEKEDEEQNKTVKRKNTVEF